jgi:polyisoprenoid-binding protein YceI
MPIPPGRYTLGPDDGTLTVRTGKTGAASAAGHNLLIEVTSWRATLDLPDGAGERSIELSADPRSLRVREGSGGMQSLGDDDKASISQTIDDEVLKGAAIEFRSRSVEAGPEGTGLRVEGDLELAGARRPVAFHLTTATDGRLTGSATLRQSDFGMKPYSTLFGTLKVADEVEVAIDARVRGS